MKTTYRITGIAPPELADQSPGTRKLFWSWVVEYGLQRKDKELSQGLDKNGQPLRAILAETRKHRRSAMTPSGKGDPAAPPLMPAYQKSRTRSLLAGRATANLAEFFWRYDAWTGDSWGVVLRYQAKKGRDVIGLSKTGTAWVKAKVTARWKAYQKGHHVTAAAAPASTRAVSVPQIGDYETTHATFGIGVSSATKFETGQWTGGLTREQMTRYFRASAKVAIPGRPINPPAMSKVVGPGYNRLLRHVWGQGPAPGRPGSAAPRRPGRGRGNRRRSRRQ